MVVVGGGGGSVCDAAALRGRSHERRCSCVRARAASAHADACRMPAAAHVALVSAEAARGAARAAFARAQRKVRATFRDFCFVGAL